MLTPTTRKRILAPVGRSLTVKPHRSTGSLLAGTHSSAGERSHMWTWAFCTAFLTFPQQTPSQRGLSELQRKWQHWSSLPEDSMEDHTHSIVETAHRLNTVTHISRTRKPGVPGRSYLKSHRSSLMQEISRVGGWSGGQLENEAGNAGKN